MKNQYASFSYFPLEVSRLKKWNGGNESNAFIDRIINPEKYPVIIQEDQIFTHKLIIREHDGMFDVFPMILWDGSALEEHNPDASWWYIKNSGQFIRFAVRDDARSFIRYCNKFMGHK
jgi:hypothetical protein